MTSRRRAVRAAAEWHGVEHGSRGTALAPSEPGLIHRYELDGFLRAVVAASCDDAAEAIVLLCLGHPGKQPTIEGETIIPGVLPGQSAWIPVSWIFEYRRRAA